jgi:hypothetical protein
VYAANCVCIYTLPRYALPLLVAVIAFGSLICATSVTAETALPDKRETDC